MKVSMTHDYVEVMRQQCKIMCGLFVEPYASNQIWPGDGKSKSNAYPPVHTHGQEGTFSSKTRFDTALRCLSPTISYLRTKRAIDYLIAITLLPLFLLTCLCVCLANLIWSCGPLFFRQTRIGYQGKPFTLIKFRTMVPSVGNPENLLTREGDARITRVGKFLRRSRLDELPQLLNVLRGEMSWIGPRPEAALLSDYYQSELPHYQARYAVMPGVTGLAQVSQGHVISIEDTHGKLSYDLFFIQHTSLMLEVWIAVRTVQIMISGFGAK